MSYKEQIGSRSPSRSPAGGDSPFNGDALLSGQPDLLEGMEVSLTPPKINMEPENQPLEKEIPIGNHHF